LRERVEAAGGRLTLEAERARRIPVEGRVVIRLLIADDQALVRGALSALLGLEPDIEVVAEVGRGDEVVDAAVRRRRRRVARHRDAGDGRDRGGIRAAQRPADLPPSS
jgi:hypothetical protein